MKLKDILTLALIVIGLTFATSCKNKQQAAPPVDATGYTTGK